MENKADFSIAPLIILSPLLGFLFQCFLGKLLVTRLGVQAGKKLCGAIAVLAVLTPFIAALVLVQRLGALPADSRSITVAGIQWIDLASFKASFDILLDPLSLTMTLIVTGVGCLIHLYATGYMAEDKDYPRFFTYMNLFIVAMLVLVLASNLVMTFVGWEGVGLCSYLLIGFWYKDLANAKAANKAFIVNRIGDFGFILGLFLLFCLMATNGANPEPLVRSTSATWQTTAPKSCGPTPDTRQRLRCSFSLAPAASPLSFHSTLGYRTRWRAQPRSPRSFMPRRWLQPAFICSTGCFPSSRPLRVRGRLLPQLEPSPRCSPPSSPLAKRTLKRSSPFQRSANSASCLLLAARALTRRACSTW